MCLVITLGATSSRGRMASSGDTSSRPLLDVEELSVGFRTRRGVVWAVDGVSFEVWNGQTVGVVGESGSGKTALSRSIMGLHRGKQVMREGRIRFDGLDLPDHPGRAARQASGRGIAMV